MTVTLTLADCLTRQSGPVLGLTSTQEFQCPNRPELPNLYKCNLFDCDGAYGIADTFVRHLTSSKHLRSFFASLNVDVVELSDAELPKKAEDHLKTEVKEQKCEVVEDGERFWIQADRWLAGQRGKKEKDKVGPYILLPFS